MNPLPAKIQVGICKFPKKEFWGIFQCQNIAKSFFPRVKYNNIYAHSSVKRV
jgi:hypothetical protein